MVGVQWALSLTVGVEHLDMSVSSGHAARSVCRRSASVFKIVEQIAEFSQIFRVRVLGDINHTTETALFVADEQ